jgi:hypothetical protein
MPSVTFSADKVKITGPRVDGSFVIAFETGEYEQDRIAALLSIPQQTPLEVTVTPHD